MAYLLLRHRDIPGLKNIEVYKQNGGFESLKKAVTSMQPKQIVEEVKASGLRGRGGAGFPTGVKWSFLPDTIWPHYVVCNADESEPGTFKDREIMEKNPFQLLEGIMITAFAARANTAYNYMRGEFWPVAKVLDTKIAELRARGFLGKNLFGTDYSLDVHLHLGAGAYICGEETALFESIEGKRGLPRVKPPFPVTHGLFGKPTAINNVETLSKVPYLITHGAAAFRRYGTEKSAGPKLFCVSGDVARPGVYEVPFGITIRHLLDDLAGGVEGGKLQAILFGGAAGAFATEKDLDVRLTFEDLRAAGLPLGSGVVMVFNETRDMRDMLLRLTKFFAHESCGKCYPCQLGTQRQMEIIERVREGKMLPGDSERLTDVGWTMTDASLCGLGQTAASAVLSAMKVWPELFGKKKSEVRSRKSEGKGGKKVVAKKQKR